MTQTTKPARPAGAQAGAKGTASLFDQPRLTFTLKLSRPVSDDAGQTWTEVTFEEPTLGHQIAAGRKRTEAEQVIALFAQISGLPESAVERMKTPDARAVQRWLAAIGGDSDVPDSSETGEAVFDLICPIGTEAQPIRSMRLREPDIRAAMMGEKFKTQNEQTAAIIAELSGLTIPVVSRLRRRDLNRIEAWLRPFSIAHESEEESGGTSP